MPIHFKKKVEDFTCDKCGTRVVGNGYTNHCPKCLWSKHVDEAIPGDRTSACQGLMQPIKLEYDHNEFIITHHCLVCGHEKRNKAASDDNLGVLLPSVL